MSRFTEGLSIKEFGVDSDKWELLSELIWEVREDVSFIETAVIDEIIVPVGFISDGASIPWPLALVFPRWGKRYRRPAVCHDAMLVHLQAGVPHPCVMTFKTADELFLEQMRATGVSLPVRYLFYAGVRLNNVVRRRH